MNTTELKAAESALEDALDKVRQLIASEPEPKTKPEPARGPLTVAPEIGTVYWCVTTDGLIHESTWAHHALDLTLLAGGNVFVSRRDAEYKAAFDAIWGQPIGEWEPDSPFWFSGLNNDIYHSSPLLSTLKGVHRFWRKGEIGFGDAGKAELERRLAEQKALDERFGL